MKLRAFSRVLPVIAFVCALPVYSQTLPAGVQKVTSAGGITEYVYPNGLHVLLMPDSSSPKITVNVTYKVGSRHEGYGETGMAHLLEHMLFIQTTAGREIKKELVGRGATWNGSTSVDRTNYYETFTAGDENLKWALGLEADRMVNMKMDKTLLDTEMTVVRNEFERGENSPQGVLSQRVVATAYLWHNYGKSTIGSREDIERVPIDRLAAFYKKYYQPDNAMLIITGRIEEAKALALVAETIGRIPRPQRKLDLPYTVEPVQDGQRYVELRRVGDGQSVMMVYHVPAAGHPDSAALEVLAGVMSGGGRGGPGAGGGLGRLSKALVDNKKAVSAGMFFRPMHDPGYVSISASLNAEQSVDDVKKIMISTVEDLASEPPTKEEVERVKTRMLRSLENQLTDSQAVGLGLSEPIAQGDWRLMFVNRDRVAKVTPEDVVRVAKTYFKESNRTVGVFIPTAKPERAEVPATPDLKALLKDYKTEAAVSAGEAFDPTPANIEKRVERAKLASGLRLVMLPKKTRGGTVMAMLELHFGDEKSLARQNAAAQMAGALLMRGTRNKTRQQLQDEMDRLKARIIVTGGGGGMMGGGRGGRGGGMMVSSGISGATAMIETTSQNLAEALKLAVEMLREPAFADADFDQVKVQRIAGLESQRSEPASLATQEMQRKLSPFAPGDARYVGTTEEQIAELKKVTLDDVRKFHQRFYGASNAELVAVGEFVPADLRKAAESILGGWKSPSPYARLVTPYKKVTAANNKIETPDKQNATFEAAIRFKLNSDEADYAALMLANAMFGGSLGARMPNRIRNVEGLSYGVSSQMSIPSSGDAATFRATAIANPGNTPKVEASFKDELVKTLAGGFTKEEVDNAKKMYRDQQTVARSQDSMLLRLLATREDLGRTMKWDEQLDARMQALTADQVNAAFRRHIVPAELIIVKAGDFAKAGVFKP